MRGKEIKRIDLIVALVLITFLTVGFALLQSNLRINGTVTTKSNSWNVYFNNVQLNQQSVSKTLPTLEGGTSLSFNVELEKPGDFYEFTVDAVNDGTIDAMISTFTSTDLTAEQEKLLDLAITYSNGDPIRQRDTLNANETKKIKVLVKFKNDLNNGDLPNGDVSVSISFAVEYVQNGASTSNESSKVWTLTEDNDSNGNISVGDLVCISTECFYVYDTSTPGQVKALARYNLYVGGAAESFEDESSWIPYGSQATGMQNIEMIGLNDPEDSKFAKGVTKFSETSNNYSGSIVEGYVNSYISKLNNLNPGLNATGKLLSKSELETLINDGNLFTSGNIEHLCAQKGYLWVYNTGSYWSLSPALSDDEIWGVNRDGTVYTAEYYQPFGYGVRPVIIFNID